MRPDDDDIATVVSAQSFELYNSTGQLVAELGVADPPLGFTASALTLNHLDSLATDSQLAWSQRDPDGSGQLVRLQGPGSVSGGTSQPPSLQLDRFITVGGSDSASLRVGPVNNVATPIATITATAGVASSNVGLLSTGAGVNSQMNLVSGGNVNMTGLNQASALGGAANQLRLSDAVGARLETASAVVSLSPTGPAEMGANGGGGSAIVRGDWYALLRRGTTGPFVQTINNEVYLGPDPTAGRLFLNGRSGYLPLGTQQYNLPGSIAPGFRSFIMNGIATAAGVVGDQYVITASIRVIPTVVAGAFIAEYQGFGGGAGVSVQRIVATGAWTVGEDHTLSATWLFTQTIAGGITWTIVGGQTGGVWNLIAPDTWFTVTHYGIR